MFVFEFSVTEDSSFMLSDNQHKINPSYVEYVIERNSESYHHLKYKKKTQKYNIIHLEDNKSLEDENAYDENKTFQDKLYNETNFIPPKEKKKRNN